MRDEHSAVNVMSTAGAVVRVGLVRALLVCAALGPSAVAHASDPSAFLSEIITPAGWEVRTNAKRCTWSNEVGTSGELVTPDGWRDARAQEPSWSGGCMCSELVVPDAWVSTTTEKRH
jgi:hypothetical protein